MSESINRRTNSVSDKNDGYHEKALFDATLVDLGVIRAVLAGILSGSETFDAGSIADGAEEEEDVTVTGAVLGDYAIASLGVDTAGLTIGANVTAADTVTVSLANNTGGAVDLASTTLRALVLPYATFAAPAALTLTS